jgi:hypothetical protein
MKLTLILTEMLYPVYVKAYIQHTLTIKSSNNQIG